MTAIAPPAGTPKRILHIENDEKGGEMRAVMLGYAGYGMATLAAVAAGRPSHLLSSCLIILATDNTDGIGVASRPGVAYRTFKG